MSGRVEIWIETGWGGALAARRVGGVVTDLALSPDDDPPTAGDRWIGRIARIDRRAGAAYVALGVGPDGFLQPAVGHEGALVAATIAQAARAEEDKGPRLVEADVASAGAAIGRLRRATPSERATALWPG
ncbi:MAG: hypothetical protein AAF684_08260, partial [Pseudomonadota bacterium]